MQSNAINGILKKWFDGLTWKAEIRYRCREKIYGYQEGMGQECNELRDWG